MFTIFRIYRYMHKIQSLLTRFTLDITTRDIHPLVVVIHHHMSWLTLLIHPPTTGYNKQSTIRTGHMIGRIH